MELKWNSSELHVCVTSSPSVRACVRACGRACLSELTLPSSFAAQLTPPRTKSADGNKGGRGRRTEDQPRPDGADQMEVETLTRPEEAFPGKSCTHMRVPRRRSEATGSDGARESVEPCFLGPSRRDDGEYTQWPSFNQTRCDNSRLAPGGNTVATQMNIAHR